MNKYATTVEEQIIKLESRGMSIPNKEKAKECLLDIGYYRLGFYWFPFEKTYPRKIKRTHEFKDGTCFDFAIQLYYFDYELRNILLKYISRIEINFRTKLIYHASNWYKDNPFWYMNKKCVKQSFIDSEVMSNALNDSAKEEVIIRDLKKYNRKFAPAWKTIEYFSFGTTVALFDNLLDMPLKCKISMEYGISSPKNFHNYIDNIRKLRNYCAHGKVLYDKSLPEAIGSGPLGYLGNSKTQLFGAYRVTEYILSRISKNRATDMRNEVKTLFDKVPDDIIKPIILHNSGFLLSML